MINLQSSPHDFDRFLSKIDKRSNDDCWNWLGHFDDTRQRGKFGANKQQYDPVHVMMIIFEGVDIPSGMMIYNVCGNKRCVYPDHYEIGIRFGRKVNNQIRTKKPLGERFWSHVDIRLQEDCWEWKASLDSKGYGQININKKQERSHRVSWELTYGNIPDGLCVLHKCDNPLCVNPYHLFLGTQKDNMQDMIEKGRRSKENKAFGENHAHAKLTDEKVRVARRLYEYGLGLPELSKMFGVSKPTIHKAIRGKSWKHVI